MTITLNRDLLRSVDRDAKALHLPRSAIIEERLQQNELDRQIREYYDKAPAADADASRGWAERGAETLAQLNQNDPWPEPATKKKKAHR